MNDDDDDRDDRDDGSDWVPPPPDDERDDPNPRAAPPADEPRPARPRILSEKQAKEQAAAKHIADAIALIGLKGTMGELLEVLTREPDTKETKTCPACGKEAQLLFSKADADGALKPRAECGKCQGDRNRRAADRMATLVRELKQTAESGSEPEKERELISQLREYGHPNLDGLIRFCEEQRGKADRGGKKGGGGGGFRPRGNSW